MAFRNGIFNNETPKDLLQDAQIASLQSSVAALTAQVNGLSVSDTAIVTAFNTVTSSTSVATNPAFTPINTVNITTTVPGYIWAMLSADVYNTGSGYGQSYWRIDINGAAGTVFQYQLWPAQTTAVSINQRSVQLQPGTYTVTAYAAQEYVVASVLKSSLYAHGNVQ